MCYGMGCPAEDHMGNCTHSGKLPLPCQEENDIWDMVRQERIEYEEETRQMEMLNDENN